MKPSNINSFYVAHDLILDGEVWRVVEYDGVKRLATLVNGEKVTLNTVEKMFRTNDRLWIVNG